LAVTVVLQVIQLHLFIRIFRHPGNPAHAAAFQLRRNAKAASERWHNQFRVDISREKTLRIYRLFRARFAQHLAAAHVLVHSRATSVFNGLCRLLFAGFLFRVPRFPEEQGWSLAQIGFILTNFAKLSTKLLDNWMG
jgi:hypothetical protein